MLSSLVCRCVMQVIAEAVIARLPEFSTQGIGNVVWGFSAVGHYHKEMYSLIAQEIPPHLSQFLPQELSNVLVGFARFGHLDPGLLQVREAGAITGIGIRSEDSIAPPASTVVGSTCIAALRRSGAYAEIMLPAL